MRSRLPYLVLLIPLVALVVSAYGLAWENGVVAGDTAPPDRSGDHGELTSHVDGPAPPAVMLRGRTAQGLDGQEPETPDRSPAEARSPTPDGVRADKKSGRWCKSEPRLREGRPTFQEFAAVLELSEAQLNSVASEVLRGQREVHAILDTPTADGRNLLTELVELTASSAAGSVHESGWSIWFRRMVTARVPGTNETYWARLKAVKTAMRRSLREILDQEQFAAYVGWEVDPTEIRGLRDSPLTEFERRVDDRVRALSSAPPEGG